MSIINKFLEIISKKNSYDNIIWNVEYKNEYVLIIANKKIINNIEIQELENLYDINIINEESISILYNDLYDLYYDEEGFELETYKQFNLPSIFKGSFQVINEGNYIVDKIIKYNFRIYDSKYDYSIYKNNIIKSDLGGEYKLLSKDLFELVKKIKEYNTDYKNYSDESKQFEMLNFIKESSLNINIKLNDRLRKESKPIVIDKIKVDVIDDGETLELIPIIDEDNNNNKLLLNTIEASRINKGSYKIKTTNGEQRYVIKNTETINSIKKNRINTGEARLNILSGKHEIFSDQNIDLSLFGPRVVGIGVLNYKASAANYNTNDLDWLEKEVEFPYIVLDNLSGDYKRISLMPEHLPIMRNYLCKMEEENTDKIEMNLPIDNKNVKVIIDKEDLKNEICNLQNRIKIPYDLYKIKDIENILKISDQYKEEKYIPYNGCYIEKGKEDIKEELNKRLIELKSNNIKKENKKESLLIAENLEHSEYEEINVIKQGKKILEIPNELKDGIELFDYQKECLCKLEQLYLENDRNGFLLCDDMGLGKTLQLLSFLCWLKERGELKPSLIVAPSSLLSNWDSENDGEIQKFFKENTFSTYKINKRLTEESLEYIKKKDIVFITYESLRNNNMLLGKIKWQVMICDEAQKIKDPKTQNTIAAKAQNAKFKIICSATPIENNMKDLWTLVDFSKPGLLGSLKEFEKQYNPRRDFYERTLLKELNDELYNKLEHYYLRREKDILPTNLPKKSIKIYNIKPSDYEIKLINEIKNSESNVLLAIKKMLTVCSCPMIYSEELVDFREMKNMDEICSKLKILKSILQEIKDRNEKVIIFEHTKKIQRVLSVCIGKWYDISCSIVNGDTSVDKRSKVISRFKKKEGFNVIILSPYVAGFGITIVEANNVIHYSRLWNPAKEDQSTDRVYRIGQKKDVTVYYPIISFGESSIKTYSDVRDYVKDYINPPKRGTSPEEKLNILLARKKEMLLDFFLAAAQCELSESEFMKISDVDSSKLRPILFSDIENKIISEYEFEALIALIYERQGYKTILTSRSCDKGVDVICLKGNDILFIQCKMTKYNIGNEAVKDLIDANAFYSDYIKKYNVKNIIVTTSNNVSNNIDEKIIVKKMYDIEKELEKFRIYKKDVNAKDNERYTYEEIIKYLCDH